MYYCERWHRHYKEMILPLTAEEAHRRDKDKDLYTVVVGEADALLLHRGQLRHVWRQLPR